MAAMRLPSLRARNLQNGGISNAVSLQLNWLWSQGSSWRTWIPTSWRLRSRGGLRLLLHMHAKSVAVLESLKAKLQIYVWVLPPHFKISGSVTYHRHDLGFGWWKKCWWSLKIWALHQMVFSLENLFIDVKAVAVYLLWEARWIK